MSARARRGAGIVTAVALLAACGEAVAPSRTGVAAAAAVPERVAHGARTYARHCASCHGTKLEGQPDWRRRRPDGRMPAPPHDESGHTWHHPDEVLFAITKYGLVPPWAPQDYASDMPAFAGVLADDEIRDVLAFIEGHWTSRDVLAARAEMVANARRR